jgi:hypothetical protein
VGHGTKGGPRPGPNHSAACVATSASLMKEVVFRRGNLDPWIVGGCNHECLCLLCTSRHISDMGGIRDSTRIEIHADDADIRTYILAQVKSRDRLLGFCSKDAALESEISGSGCIKGSENVSLILMIFHPGCKSDVSKGFLLLNFMSNLWPGSKTLKLTENY